MKIKLFSFPTLTLFAVILFMLPSCVSSTKQLQKGNYDDAIEKAVKTLLKNPGKFSEIETLKSAYSMANRKDEETIRQLKISGQPDIFEKVLDLYLRLQKRQETVGRLPSTTLARIKFKHKDYSSDVAESKNKAAAYLDSHASWLLISGKKTDARQAYAEFLKVKEFFPHYKLIDSKIDQAYQQGINHVIIIFENDSRTALPQDFEQDMMKISLRSLNEKWINFHTHTNKNTTYDYAIYLIINNIQISPDFLKEKDYKEEKEVADGFTFSFDNNGNVMKDSDGNNIKIPRMKTITCYVAETELKKQIAISGTIEFWDRRNIEFIESQPIRSEFLFHHRFARASGDLEAMSDKTKELIKFDPAPFPTNLQMIYDSNKNLKKQVMEIISANRKLLYY